jgi:RhtB (resistance to homoserine/threonine) family protein
MDQLLLLGSLLAVDLLAAMSPGPNFLLVSQSALAMSRRHALAVVGGIVAGNLLWCLAVVLGLSAVFVLVPWLHTAVQIAGGAYLVYLGVRLWTQPADSTAPGVPTAGGSRQAAFLRGFVTSATNPKSVVYFGSIFAVFLGPGSPGWLKLAAVAIVIADTVLWYGTMALVFSTQRVQRGYASIRRPIDRLAGGVMAAFGARLLLVRE